MQQSSLIEDDDDLGLLSPHTTELPNVRLVTAKLWHALQVHALHIATGGESGKYLCPSFAQCVSGYSEANQGQLIIDCPL